jgi:hypothetical protein
MMHRIKEGEAEELKITVTLGILNDLTTQGRIDEET